MPVRREPMTRPASALRHSSGQPSAGPEEVRQVQPADQRLESGMAPLPLMEVRTGARRVSASLRRSFVSGTRDAPPPAMMMGYFASRRSLAVRLIAWASGDGGAGMG